MLFAVNFRNFAQKIAVNQVHRHKKEAIRPSFFRIDQEPDLVEEAGIGLKKFFEPLLAKVENFKAMTGERLPESLVKILVSEGIPKFHDFFSPIRTSANIDSLYLRNVPPLFSNDEIRGDQRRHCFPYRGFSDSNSLRQVRIRMGLKFGVPFCFECAEKER